MAQVVGSMAMSSDPGSRFERCREKSLAILQKAADEWTLGNPEQPPTNVVLEMIIRTFEHEHFLKRGFGKLLVRNAEAVRHDWNCSNEFDRLPMSLDRHLPHL